MDIKKLKDTSEESLQQKPNFGQLINRGGIGLKGLVADGGSNKLQALSDSLYEIVDLPSRGWTYPENSVLSTGRIKIKYPTGADEAILTSQHLIRKGLAVDEFLKALILQNFKLQDLLSGDKAYLVYASRRLTYGNDYQIEAECTKCGKPNKLDIDLTTVIPKQTPELFEFPRQQDEFSFILPSTQQLVKFQLQTGHIAKIIEKRTQNSKNKNAQSLIELSCYITEFDDAVEYADILRKLMVAKPNDLKELRLYIARISPDINIKHPYECEKCYRDTEVNIPITVSFFWPTFA